MPGQNMATPRVDIDALRRGDRRAFAQLADDSLDRMYDVAIAIVTDPTAAVGVCADVLDALHDRRRELTRHDVSRNHLLLATRQRALSFVRLHGQSQRPPSSGAHAKTTADIAPEGAGTTGRLAAVRAASAVLGPATVSALDLHYRHGVDASALAIDVGAAGDRAQRRLNDLRRELEGVLGAHALWNGGRPTCADLAAELGLDAPFDTTTSDTIDRHQPTCAECSRIRQADADPSSAMLAAPIVALSESTRSGVIASITGLRGDSPVDEELESDLPRATPRGDVRPANVGRTNLDQADVTHRSGDPEPEPDDDHEIHSLWGDGRGGAHRAVHGVTGERPVLDEASIQDLWESTRVVKARPSKERLADDATPTAGGDHGRSVAESTTTLAAVPARPTDEADERRRKLFATIGGAAAVVLIVGVVAIALWPGGTTEVSEPSVAANATSDSEPEVRSLGPPPTGSTPDATDATTTVSETTQPTNTRPTTTEPGPVRLPQRSELPVAAANGANVAGAAARIADRLEAAGFADVLPLDGTVVIDFTVVYYAEGFEEAARGLAEELDLLPDFVAPIDEMPGVEDLPNNVAIVAYVGLDRA